MTYFMLTQIGNEHLVLGHHRAEKVEIQFKLLFAYELISKDMCHHILYGSNNIKVKQWVIK